MNKYKLTRDNCYKEYKAKINKKEIDVIKLRIVNGVLGVASLALVISNPQNFVNAFQNIGYCVNETFTDTSDICNLDPIILEDFEFFENKLLENIPIEYLENYNNNIKDLKYYNNSNDLNKFFDVSGYYSVTWNRLVNISYDKAYRHILFHELMHLASTRDKKCGFATKKHAVGLTEGYTEYLVLKFFDEDIETVFAYTKEKIIVNILNKLIGENKMIKYYFTNDIESLKQDLCNIWGTEKDIAKLIQDIDKYTLKKDNEKLNDITCTLMKYVYMDQIKKNHSLNIDVKLESKLEALKYNCEYSDLKSKVLNELEKEIKIGKYNQPFVNNTLNNKILINRQGNIYG